MERDERAPPATWSSIWDWARRHKHMSWQATSLFPWQPSVSPSAGTLVDLLQMRPASHRCCCQCPDTPFGKGCALPTPPQTLLLPCAPRVERGLNPLRCVLSCKRVTSLRVLQKKRLSSFNTDATRSLHTHTTVMSADTLMALARPDPLTRSATRWRTRLLPAAGEAALRGSLCEFLPRMAPAH